MFAIAKLWFVEISDSAILNFMGPITALLTTYGKCYMDFSETIALNCLLFEIIAFLYTHFGDRRTNGQTDGHHECVKPL